MQVIQNIKKITISPDIWLIFSPIKQHRMNLAIQKATELGVSKIIPCITEYTNIRTINIQSLYDNAIEAAEQSERLDIPKIQEQIDLKSLLTEWPKDRKLIYCDEKISNGKEIISTLLPLKDENYKWGVLVGPEGGFSNTEKELITKKKYVIPVSLGDRPLRSDTAITVSLFCINKLLDK